MRVGGHIDLCLFPVHGFSPTVPIFAQESGCGNVCGCVGMFVGV